MHPVRLFCLKFFLLLTIIAGVIGMTIALIPPDAEGYFQASLLKSNLLRNTPSPRLLIAGGSNVAFAVDSDLLEANLGLPVVNLGIHGGIGKSTYEELGENIHSGDIILLMPEYVIFEAEGVLEGNDVPLAQWIEYDLRRLHLVSPARAPALLLTIAQIKAGRGVVSFLSGGQLNRGVYNSDNFNSRGDFIGQVTATAPIKRLQEGSYFKSDTYYMKTFAFFEQLNQDAMAKGAVVYFEFPASRESNCRATGQERFKELYAMLQEWTTIPVLTNLDEICFPNSYFFDTNYHLNGVGRQAMTLRIIKDLLPLMAK